MHIDPHVSHKKACLFLFFSLSVYISVSLWEIKALFLHPYLLCLLLFFRVWLSSIHGHWSGCAIVLLSLFSVCSVAFVILVCHSGHVTPVVYLFSIEHIFELITWYSFISSFSHRDLKEGVRICMCVLRQVNECPWGKEDRRGDEGQASSRAEARNTDT